MANQQGGFTPPARVKTILDSDCMVMRAPSTEAGKYATLTFGIYQNNPRITVYTNDQNDQQNDKGKIQAAFDPKTMIVFLGAFKQMIDFVPTPEKKEDKVVCECSNYIFTGGKKSNEPLLQARVIVGKNVDGKVYIVVAPYKKERPRIQFFFGIPADKYNGNVFHKLLHGNGDPYTESEISCRYAEASLKILQKAFEHMMIVGYVDIPRNKEGNSNNNGGNNGGGYNNRGNGGARNNPAPSSSGDDDLADW